MDEIKYEKFKIKGAVIKFPSNVSEEYCGTIDTMLTVAKLKAFKLEYNTYEGSNFIDVMITKDGYPSYTISFLRDSKTKIFYGILVLSSSNIEENEDFKKMSSLDKIKYITKLLLD